MEAANAYTPTNSTSSSSEKPSCPPWCVADHDSRESFSYPQTHHSATIRLVPAGSGFHRWIAAEALDNDSDLWRIGPVVFLNANSMGHSQGPWPHLYLSARNARAIADIIAVLAGASPEQHLYLAQGMRRCAALIDDGGEDASGEPE